MAVLSSSLSIFSLNKTANETSRNSAFASKTLRNINQIMGKRTKVKRDAFLGIKREKDKRVEDERRKERQDEIEAPNTVVRPDGPQKLVQADTPKGFFDRIFGFLGYLAAGWIMNNLPTWIAMGKEFIARLQKAGEIVSGFFNNTIKLFSGVGNLLGSIGQNLISLDLFDTSNRVKNSFAQLNSTVAGLGNQIEEAFGILTTPLTEGKYSGQDIPKVGTEQTSEGAYTPQVSMSGGSNEQKTMNFLISNGLTVEQAAGISGNVKQESGFRPNADNGGHHGIAQWDKVNRWPRVKSYIESIGKDPESLEGQLYGLVWEAKQRGNWQQISRAKTLEESSSIWLRKFEIPGNYEIEEPHRASLGRTILNSYKKSGQQPQIEQVAPGKVSPTITSRYGDLIGTRRHGGTDLATNQGTPLRAISDGVIVDSDFEAGWGNFLVMKDNLGIYHLYGHMQSGYKRGGPVKKGEVIGKVGMTGRTSGPHLHWEAGTGWTGGVLTGKFDPLNKYSKFAPFNTAPGPGVVSGTPAQIAEPPAASQQRQEIPISLTPERRAQDIIVAQPPNKQNIITTPSGGGAAPSSTPINDFDLLNNFMKNKLLLDLAYL
jgi:murein DD-endopeptidase MepM/ murein hydrolase activator NlpD